MNGRFDVLVDDARALTTDAVLAGRHDAEFVPAARSNTNFGFTDAAVWARFAIHYAAVDGAPPVLTMVHVPSPPIHRQAHPASCSRRWNPAIVAV